MGKTREQAEATMSSQTSRAAEILAMVVHNHCTGRPGLGHALPIGEPWLPGHYAGLQIYIPLVGTNPQQPVDS